MKVTVENKKGLNKDTPAFFKRVQPQFAYDGVGNPKATNKNSKYDDFLKDWSSD